MPTPVVERPAYRFARRTASRSGNPSARKTAKLPINASPAPVLSTAFTGNAGRCSFTSRPARREPFAPSVMMTRRMPPARSGPGRWCSWGVRRARECRTSPVAISTTNSRAWAADRCRRGPPAPQEGKDQSHDSTASAGSRRAGPYWEGCWP